MGAEGADRTAVLDSSSTESLPNPILRLLPTTAPVRIPGGAPDLPPPAGVLNCPRQAPCLSGNFLRFQAHCRPNEICEQLKGTDPGRKQMRVVTSGTPGVRAAKQATKTIPIVIAAVGGDPVALGLVVSLARPGGNVTGSTFIVTDFGAKRPEILKAAIPRLRRCALLLNPDNPSMTGTRLALENAATLLRIELSEYEARGPKEINGAFSAMAIQQIEAIVLFDDPIFNAHSKLIAALSTNYKFPSIGNREFAEAGGLMSYGPNILSFYQRAATYVDKILKGARPADLPVEQPTQYELVINLKTAKTLGLTIPQSMLNRADRVIE